MPLNCTSSALLEAMIFDKIEDKKNIPEENCSLCCYSLREKTTIGCSCSRYTKKFKNCDHYVHVSCFMSRGEEDANKINSCPVCDTSTFK